VKAAWTYQVPPAGADATGLEDYVVEARDGEATGKVIALFDRDGERYVLFDMGNPAVTPRRSAVPWRDVESVDHDTLTVRLALGESDLAAAVELDPANEIEDGDAEAVRVTELPRELTPSSGPEQGPGPIDRPTYVGAIALFALGLIALLGLALVASSSDFTWEFALFVVPALFLVAAGVLAYRTFREPYER
jgi:hypothetical protein